jgi:hypothetical protein
VEREKNTSLMPVLDPRLQDCPACSLVTVLTELSAAAVMSLGTVQTPLFMIWTLVQVTSDYLDNRRLTRPSCRYHRVIKLTLTVSVPNTLRSHKHSTTYSRDQGAQWRSRLRHCATSRKVAGSILIDFILPAALWPCGRLSH